MAAQLFTLYKTDIKYTSFTVHPDAAYIFHLGKWLKRSVEEARTLYKELLVQGYTLERPKSNSNVVIDMV